MTGPNRFLQIHTLTSYSASLLNRDDVGFAKRLPFGGAIRARVSSQCLKRHWRTADDDNALSQIQLDGDSAPMSLRSRRIFEREIHDPLVAEGGLDQELVQRACERVLEALLPEGKAKKTKKETTKSKGATGVSAAAGVARTDQVIVLGVPEVRYLRELVRAICTQAKELGLEPAADAALEKDLRKNLAALRLGAGLDAAMFGRMTTGDILSRCDAAVHVAHAFTVHDGFFETDYFSAVDDLQEEGETGSGHINTSELASGLFYGYVVVDVPLLVSNLQGCDRKTWLSADRTLASEVVRRLVHLVATVSPGAKLGATAPYAYSHLVCVEQANAQPRTLANAFLAPIQAGPEGLIHEAYRAFVDHARELDAAYPPAPSRRFLALQPTEALAGMETRVASLPVLAEWAASGVRGEA